METCVCANRIAGARNVDRPGIPQDGHIFSWAPRREPCKQLLVRSMAYPLFRTRRCRLCLPTFGGKDYHQRKAFMSTKGMIRLSWQKIRNSRGTSHHPRCNVLLAHGGCVPLGFCAEDHGRKLRIVLNPRCSGSASTSTSSASAQYGSFTRHSLRPQRARLFSPDNILDRMSRFKFSSRKSMAGASSTQL